MIERNTYRGIHMTDQYYDEFLEITGSSRNFIEDINDFLLDHNCKREIKTAKSGFTVSYLFQDAKRTLATFVCRKTGIKIRIHPQRLNEYMEFLDTLPAKMKKEIAKASVCKRLVNPDDCNPKCIMGYDFIMDQERYQKCRYMAFLLTITEESVSYIMKFLQNELTP